MTTTRPHIVSGERLYLSHFQRSDVPVITHWLSNLETTAYLGMQGRSFLQEQEEDWYTNYTRLDDKNFHFAIVARDSDTIIGTVSLMDIRRPHDRAELGIVIGNTDYWSKGYGREAIRNYQCFCRRSRQPPHRAGANDGIGRDRHSQLQPAVY